jgi:hypothetical protein
VHISELLRKAARQLNCLKRVAYHFDIKVKILLYKSFVLSNFNYCCAVWHLCGATNTKKLERLQYRALKFIYTDYTATYQELLDRAGLPTLALARIRVIAVEVYKAHNAIGPKFLSETFTQAPRHYNLRSQNRIAYTNNRTTRNGLHSFRHYGAKIWNSLPNEIRLSTDLNIFKSFIKTWTGPSCQCNFCGSD